LHLDLHSQLHLDLHSQPNELDFPVCDSEITVALIKGQSYASDW